MNLREAYEVLGIAVGTPEAEVRSAYKDLVAVWHPDRFQNNARLRQKAEAKLKQINGAFQTIEDAGFPHAPPRTGSQGAAGTQEHAEPPSKGTTRATPKRATRRIAWLCSAAVLGGLSLLIYTGDKGGRAVPDRPATSWNHAQKQDGPADAPSLPEPQPANAAPKHQGEPEWSPFLSKPQPANAAPKHLVVVLPPATTQVTQDEASRNEPTGARAVPSGYFSLGATAVEVRRVQGTPTSIIGNTWGYQFSSVEFGPDGRVVSYSDISKNLKVRVPPRPGTHKSPGFALGSTKDTALAVQGTPTSIIGDTWGYEFSSVEFGPDGRVVSYSDISKNLKVR